MAIKVACPNCRNPLAVPEGAVGKQGKCKACGSIFTISLPPAADAPVSAPAAPASAPAPRPAAKKVEMECPHCGVVVRGLPETFNQPITCPDCKATDFFEPASPPEQPFWKKMPFLVAAGAAVLLLVALGSYALSPQKDRAGSAATEAEAERPGTPSSGSHAKATTGEADRAESKQTIADDQGNKPVPREAAASHDSMSFQELSDEESGKYPSDKALAGTALTGNIFDSRSNALLCTDADMAKVREAAARLDLSKAWDRDRMLQEFVRIFGVGKAKEIGLRVHDGEGKVRYVWPRAAETAKSAEAEASRRKAEAEAAAKVEAAKVATEKAEAAAKKAEAEAEEARRKAAIPQASAAKGRNAHIAEAIRQENELEAASKGKGSEFDTEAFQAVMKLGSKETLQELARLSGLEPLQAFGLQGMVGQRFLRKDNTYPRLGKLNPDADSEAYTRAVRNLTPAKVQKIVDLNPEGDRVQARAVTLLLAAAGQFVDRKGSVNTKASDAALANLSPEKVEKSKAFFSDKTEACYVLLRASGRFIGKDGDFDQANYNAVLNEITPAKVEEVKKQLTQPNAATAFDILLRP